MNWYKKASSPDSEIFGWPEMESTQHTDIDHNLYWEWVSKNRKLQGMALKAQEMMDLLLEAMRNNDEEKIKMYTQLLEDWRDEHSERVMIPDGGKKFEVNLFEDGSLW